MAAADFIDECHVHVQAGDGGRGCSSFRREKFVPKGGPDGGAGGRGGSVVFVGDAGMTTLYDARHRKHYRARRGQHGQGANKTGRSGEDTVVHVPIGTAISDAETGLLLVELLRHGDRFVVAAGGRGGRGNASFATSTHQAPTFCEPGEPGEVRDLRLELKVLADVGLIGFPNAGKSTFISRVSGARPRIASYPFTTLRPHLGMVESVDPRFVIADIPGLIPGAHAGVGLGHQFLRHVERTRVLLHLLDPEPLLKGEPGRSPLADHRALRAELGHYSSALARRVEICVLTKGDLVDASTRAEIERPLHEADLHPHWISAATGEGVEATVSRLASRLGLREAEEPSAAPAPGPVEAERGTD